MALKLIWQSQAADELAGIYDFIAVRDDEIQAAKVAQQLYDFVLSIPERPLLGRMVPEFERADLRERIHDRCRIVYRLTPDSVTILTIWDTARPLPDVRSLFRG